jgi:hypothetical protein
VVDASAALAGGTVVGALVGGTVLACGAPTVGCTPAVGCAAG